MTAAGSTPNVISYNTPAISAYEKGQQGLRRIPELLEEMTTTWIMPNVICYNAPAISAREKGQQGLKRILQLLEEMTPNLYRRR